MGPKELCGDSNTVFLDEIEDDKAQSPQGGV
jgi:hypothetical protein